MVEILFAAGTLAVFEIVFVVLVLRAMNRHLDKIARIHNILVKASSCGYDQNHKSLDLGTCPGCAVRDALDEACS